VRFLKTQQVNNMKSIKILSLIIILILTLFLFLFFNCKREWSYSQYIQKIEGSPKILCKYFATGGRDTVVQGYVIEDSSAVFEVDLSKNLPFFYLQEIPNSKSIIGIEIEKHNFDSKSNSTTEFCKPLKILNILQEGISVKSKLYQSAGFDKKCKDFGYYKFEKFIETRDTLFFYNLDEPYEDSHHLNSLKIKKGNVLLYQNERMEITEIEIEDIRFSKSDEILYNKLYRLIPKNKLLVSQFSDYGIFKLKPHLTATKTNGGF
jgi:hypothetical protein